MTKLGAHIVPGPRNGYGELLDAQPAVVLSVGDGGALVEAKQRAPDCVTIYRHTLYLDAPPGIDYTDEAGAIEMAYNDYPLLRAEWQINPADFYQLTNEGAGNEAHLLRVYIAYERKIMQLAQLDGYRVCVLNYAAGQPHWELWRTISAPFILEAWANGHIYGRHVYGLQHGDLVNDDWTLTAFAARLLEEDGYLRSQGGVGKIAVTECGLDGGYSFDHDRFVRQVTRYEQILRAWNSVIGICCWTLGNWADANWQGAIPAIVAYMQDAPTPPEPPPPDPPDETLPEFLWRVGLDLAPTNYDAALQRKILEHSGWYPYGRERWQTHDGTSYAIQPAINWESRARRVYYAEVPNWQNVIWIDSPAPPPDPGPPQHTIPVDPLSQRDPRWASQTIGQPTGHGKTIGDWGCLYIAYYMMAKYWGIESRGVLNTHTHWVNAGAFSDQFLRAGALKIAYPNVVNNGWLSRSSPNMIPTIREYLTQGIPVAARVDFNPATPQWEQHWVLLVGENAHDWLMVDPWHGDIAPVASRYGIEGSDILEAVFYKPPTAPQPPPPGVQVDLHRYMVADPDCWRVVKHVAPDGNETNEDVQDMELGGGMYVRRKNSLAEWWSRDTTLFYLIHDTSPDPGGDGIQRLYTLYKGGLVGAPKNPTSMTVGTVWRETGHHFVQFRSKHGCYDLGENSGFNQNSAVITRLESNFTFNSYGQNLTFDSVIWIHTGVETQVYARKDGRSCGWVGWEAPWGYSEPVEIHWNRGRMTQEPDRICSW